MGREVKGSRNVSMYHRKAVAEHLGGQDIHENALGTA